MSYPRRSAQRGVDELVGRDGVLALLRLAQGVALDALQEAQSRKDAVRAYELVYAALGA